MDTVSTLCWGKPGVTLLARGLSQAWCEQEQTEVYSLFVKK